MILAVVGLRLSGKNTVAEYIRDKYGFVWLDYTRDLLAPILRKHSKSITRENLKTLAMDLREESGNDILTRMICEKIQPGKNYVISGTRFRESIDFLRKKFGKTFHLISVECQPKKRYERAKLRQDKGEGKLSFQKFMRMENLPTERPIPEVMKLADFTLENNGTRKELFSQIDKLMDKVK